jgi:zinc/manganese transport system substrate-binding protein
MNPRPLPLLAFAGVGILALAGCSAPEQPAADAAVSIVASTIVYGDIAARVAGDAATVTSLITSSAQDPHSYEASAQDQLAISKADIVIENGGGYDPFIDTLLEASASAAVVISASETSGLMPEEGDDHEGEEDHAEEGDDHDHAHIEGFNEHVWYDVHAIEALAEALAAELSELDPANADTFAANAEAFAADLEPLEATAEALHERLEGSSVAVTEPVALYLLAEVGLDNVTPEAFTEAIEEGGDVPPSALNETLQLIESGGVALLAYNSQTASAETERVREAAEAAGIPIVEFTETLPDGEDYVSWMTANLDAIAAALPA